MSNRTKLVSVAGWGQEWRVENYICTQKDLKVFMLRVILSMNFSAKYESLCPHGFYKVILLCCLNHFSMSTVYLQVLKEKVKAQGGRPDSGRCGSPCQNQTHSLHLDCLSTPACGWKRTGLHSRTSFCCVFALRV